jgi:hypothetical protein
MRHHFLLLTAGAVAALLLFLASQSSLAQKNANDRGIASLAKYVTVPGAALARKLVRRAIRM